MANLLEDIQCVDSDTQPHMLDRTDFTSWQQRIRLYCQGKENGLNILKSNDEGPFQMEKERYNADIRATNILLQGLPKDIYTLINHYTDAKDIWDNVKMLLEGSKLTKEDRFAKLINDMQNIKMTMSRMQLNSNFVNNMLPEWGRFMIAVKLNRGLRDSNYDQLGTIHMVEVQLGMGKHRTELGMLIQNSDYFKDKMLLMQAQENGVALDEEQLLFLADDCDVCDSDVDEPPTAQTMFMANLSSLDPVYDESGPSYDSDTLSEVHDHDHYQDVVCEHHEEHEMHDNVHLNHVVDSHADYTSDSNMILYDQYVKDNAVPGVQSNVYSVQNDAYMMIYNDMYEPHAQSVSKTSRNIVVDNSLTAKLATYKEQVELYKRRARFELTKKEQKIDEQLRIVITNCNFKEETLKKELHSVKLQLASTINHNKSMVEEVTSLKKDFKQKENKYLEEFLDMKSLIEKVFIGYKNPLCLTRAKQVLPALYNGHEIIKNNHISAIVHNTEDTLEIAEITRRKMNDKIKDLKCVNHNVKIAPHDYSKENFLATFIP
uniref:Integrase, catalytic region, zinc finger, CCHC-type, peptidase aspartic, catalytic n=1 Tax=Tanacetum cinerariifolium TaxID=118510 RepID=A0A699GST8_TANCI|nr:hypothetical protein [Tanacetum cinerariifolium]